MVELQKASASECLSLHNEQALVERIATDGSEWQENKEVGDDDTVTMGREGRKN